MIVESRAVDLEYAGGIDDVTRGRFEEVEVGHSLNFIR